MKLRFRTAASSPLVADDAERCAVYFAPFLGDAQLEVEAGIRCPETAVTTVEARCWCGHFLTERVCEGHGTAGSGPPGSCATCGQAGHRCPVGITRIG